MESEERRAASERSYHASKLILSWKGENAER
jgi:hypothetical protein